MKYVKHLFKEKSILFLLLPFLIVMLYLILAYGKGPSHLLVNSWHSPEADFFFKYMTQIGDGIFFVVVILLLSFIRFRWALYQLLAALLTLFVVAMSKKVFFKGMARPSRYFENTEVLHLVDGVRIYADNTFPSGHTITAVAIFVILLFIVKNRYLKVLFVILAILAGFSRVYLSQHFLVDVFSGVIIGLLIAVLSCTIVDNSAGLNKANWIDKNLLQILGRGHDR